MNFGEILKSLREKKGITQKKMSEILGISKSNISKYEAGTVEPNIETLRKYASYFGVSVDCLLGTDSQPSIAQESNEGNGYFFFFFDNLLRDVFKNRLQKSLLKKNMNVSDLYEAVSFDCETCQKYLDGEIEPSMENLIELSQVLDVSTDYLLGQIPQISQIEKKILNTFVKLNVDNQDIIIGKAKELLKEQEQTNLPVAAEGFERKVSGK